MQYTCFQDSFILFIFYVNLSISWKFYSTKIYLFLREHFFSSIEVSSKRSKLPGETKETIKWTNTELQRVVMLEQLKYYRLKSLKLKNTTPHHILNEEEIDIVDINVDGNKT